MFLPCRAVPRRAAPRRFFQLNRLMMWHLPDLFEHFEACGVQTNLFATSWFVTLLSDGGMLPDDEV